VRAFAVAPQPLTPAADERFAFAEQPLTPASDDAPGASR
jgi:hypothetical protein